MRPGSTPILKKIDSTFQNKKKNPWGFCPQGFIREWELATLSSPSTGYLAPGPISRLILLFASAASFPTLFTTPASRRGRSFGLIAGPPRPSLIAVC